MYTKRKKKIRQRGSLTHGWGAKKKHRGAGNRGGRGMAGSGKRADQKKPTIIKEFGLKNYFGKHGFKRKNVSKIKTINIGDLNFDKQDINLTELGYNKLLGKGIPNKKYIIQVKSFTKKAKEKIEKAGGQIKT